MLGGYWFANEGSYTRVVVSDVDNEKAVKMRTWLLENVGNGNFLMTGWSDYSIRLKNESDAIMFSLKWVGHT